MGDHPGDAKDASQFKFSKRSVLITFVTLVTRSLMLYLKPITSFSAVHWIRREVQ